jgi:hypothetical protein
MKGTAPPDLRVATGRRSVDCGAATPSGAISWNATATRFPAIARAIGAAAS